MNSKLIRLKDRTLLEVEVRQEQPEQVSSTNAKDVNRAFDEQVKPTLITLCNSINNVWQEVSQNTNIEQAEVEIGLSFELEGNIYITKAKAASNLTVKLTLKKGRI